MSIRPNDDRDKQAPFAILLLDVCLHMLAWARVPRPAECNAAVNGNGVETAASSRDEPDAVSSNARVATIRDGQPRRTLANQSTDLRASDTVAWTTVLGNRGAYRGLLRGDRGTSRAVEVQKREWVDEG